MKVSHWYSIKDDGESITISYSKLNRIMSVFVFVLITSVFVYYNYISNWTPGLLSTVVISLILLVSLFASIVIDKYNFDLKGDALSRSFGIYPFVKVQRIPIRNIKNIEIQNFENTSFLYHAIRLYNRSYKNGYFNMKLNLNDDTMFSLGSFKDDYKYIINRLKEDVLLQEI